MICGPNGAGKTGVLESISLLTPGRGFRASHFAEICTHQSEVVAVPPWQSRFVFSDDTSIICSYDIQKKRKQLCRDDGTAINSQDLLEKMRILWLVPEMDGLFLESSSTRRRFLDRMVYSFFPWHAENCAKYNHYLKSRLRLLKDGCFDDVWLRGIEHSLASLALDIACARVMIAQIVGSQMGKLPIELLPATMRVNGSIEEIVMNFITNLDDVDLIDFWANLSCMKEYQECAGWIQNKFQTHRAIDNKAKQSTFGIHRSDMIVAAFEKKLNAKFCSTGEQKILLLTLLLGHAIKLDQHLRQNKHLEARMILLLDDALAYLDESKQIGIVSAICKLNAQVFITTSDKNCPTTIGRAASKMQLIG